MPSKWNWQQPDWPSFSYDKVLLEPLEAKFLQSSGLQIGSVKHLTESDQEQLLIALISNEALRTSEIEGEILNRDSVQASICRQFGLEADGRQVPPSEQGISEMMVSVYRTWQEPLTDDTLFDWHRMVTLGRRDLSIIGAYRMGGDPMQIVSGYVNRRTVHYEAPPSETIPSEMARLLSWFNGSETLPALTRAGIAHLHFESIHPFEDGNGRIGRALAEKSLAQSLGQPTLIALADTIQRHRKDYYDALAKASKQNEITNWLVYFGNTVLEAQVQTLRHIEFLIGKTKLYDRLRGQLNSRQEKALARMFAEGPDGFKGGLSAENYIKITTTSRATATRDLQELVELNALTRTGERKSTRYYLNSG